jgi:hypothetical protein
VERAIEASPPPEQGRARHSPRRSAHRPRRRSLDAAGKPIFSGAPSGRVAPAGPISLCTCTYYRLWRGLTLRLQCVYLGGGLMRAPHWLQLAVAVIPGAFLFACADSSKLPHPCRTRQKRLCCPSHQNLGLHYWLSGRPSPIGRSVSDRVRSASNLFGGGWRSEWKRWPISACAVQRGAELFDHRVGDGEERRRHLDAEQLGFAG